MTYNSIDFSFDALESKLLGDGHCGIEIDYDPEFLELENLVASKAEQQYGDTIIPAAPIDWSSALNKACDLLGKSKDYRLCCIITRALTHKYGVRGALKGIESIRALTDHFWQDAYPAISFDGELDLFPRANAIAELNSYTGLVGDLRQTDIKLGVAGKIGIATIERILSGRADGEAFSREQLLQLLRDETHNQNNELHAIQDLLTQVTELEQQLTQHFGSQEAPDLSTLKNLLASINPIRDQYSHTPSSVEDEVVETNPVRTVSTHAGVTAPTHIRTRADAIQLLDKVCEFLEQNDPANPAPLLIKRARNMIGQDFYSILSQLAPDAVAQAEVITGPKF